MIYIDRIIAMIIAAMVLLLGITTQQRARQSSVESTMLYVGKKQTLELADMLERDLANVGYQTTPGQDAITYYSRDDNDMLDTLQFWGLRRDSVDGAAEQVEIRYRLVEADTVEIDGTVVQLYQLKRFEHVGGVWQARGASPTTITRFYLDLLNENNNAAPPDQATRIQVRLENAVAPKLDPGRRLNGLRSLHWSTTLSPPSIRGYQGQ